MVKKHEYELKNNILKNLDSEDYTNKAYTHTVRHYNQ